MLSSHSLDELDWDLLELKRMYNHMTAVANAVMIDILNGKNFSLLTYMNSFQPRSCCADGYNNALSRYP